MKEILFNDSENIRTSFYFNESKELWVFFKSSSLYIYKNIDFDIVSNLIKAKDKGKYFYDNIRNTKKYTKKY